MEFLADRRYSLSHESHEEEITHLMAAGEQALVEGNFTKAQRIFMGLIHAAPGGRITAWPHFTRQDQEQDRSLRFFMQKPHAPTQGDVSLGLCFAYLGQGEGERAEFYLRKSGFFTLSPANFAERKETCRLAGEHYEEVRQIMAREGALRKHRSLTGWEKAFEAKGYEGVVCTEHVTWLDAAAGSFLDQVHQNAISQNDLVMVNKAFVLIDKLYGCGRGMPVKIRDPKLYGYACEYAKSRQYELAVAFLKEYTKHEEPYIVPAGGVLENWATGALNLNKGNLIQEEWLLEQIPSLEPSYEYEMTESEYRALKLGHLQHMHSGYYFLLEKARKLQKNDLVGRFTKRNREIEQEISRRKQH